MTQVDRGRLIEVVGEAMRLPEHEREVYVRTACPLPAEREEALNLLSALKEAGGFMEGNAPADAGAALKANGSQHPGTTIGRYRLLGMIGEGGFGHVFMAQQFEPVVRRVALKIIKPGMDSRGVINRFEAERQALAMMNHPGIATVFDGGATDSGRPYFVMELVKGEPITAFCDHAKLPIEDRLALFRDVCAAVQHAHQKGVIHRDLKPTNVLVSESDGRPHPKVIDFGIAKATIGRLAGGDDFTDFRQFIGTPEYMSPEQTLGPGGDVDTRCDIYSLGVILYELLTGTTPLDRESLRSAGLEDMQRRIRDTKTPSPSTRLSTLGTRAQIAAHRRSAPEKLGHLLRGDLDWIVLRALEKDRERRYESVGAFAEDVRRFLQHEPVAATPPSTIYRVRKFVQRHRTGVIAAMLVGAALVAGVIGTSSGLVASIAERNRAEEANTFITSMLQAVIPGVARGEDTTLMRRILDDAAARLDAGEVADPRIDAELRHTIGVAYTRINQADAAEPMLRRAVELRTAAMGPDDPLTLQSLVQLGNACLSQGKGVEAEATLRAAYVGLRRQLGDGDRRPLDALNDLGVTLEKQGRSADAAACFRDVMNGLTQIAGPEDDGAVNATYNLGLALLSQGRYTDAEPYLGQALQMRRHLFGDDDPSTLTAMNSFASLLGETSRMDQAESLLREALGGCRRMFGPDHPDTLNVVNSMGVLLVHTGRPAEAEPYLRQAMEGWRRRWGNSHPDTLGAIANMAGPLQALGRADEAEAMHREATEGMRSSPDMGPNHPRTLIAIVTYATFLRDQGRFREAETLAAEAYDGFRRTLGAENSWTCTAAHSLGLALRAQSKLDEAEPLLHEAADGRRKVLGPDHPRTLNSVTAYASLLADTGRFADAERELLQSAQDAHLEDGPVPPGQMILVRTIAQVYEMWNKAEPDSGHAAQAASWRAKESGN